MSTSPFFRSVRVWWNLHAMGIRNVRILEGGLDAWVSQGYPVESGKGTVVEKFRDYDQLVTKANEAQKNVTFKTKYVGETLLCIL